MDCKSARMHTARLLDRGHNDSRAALHAYTYEAQPLNRPIPEIHPPLVVNGQTRARLVCCRLCRQCPALRHPLHAELPSHPCLGITLVLRFRWVGEDPTVSADTYFADLFAD